MYFYMISLIVAAKNLPNDISQIIWSACTSWSMYPIVKDITRFPIDNLNIAMDYSREGMMMPRGRRRGNTRHLNEHAVHKYYDDVRYITAHREITSINKHITHGREDLLICPKNNSTSIVHPIYIGSQFVLPKSPIGRRTIIDALRDSLNDYSKEVDIIKNNVYRTREQEKEGIYLRHNFYLIDRAVQ